MNHQQLWKAASQSCALPLFAVGTRCTFRDAGGLRALFWPDGTPCWEVTAYLINLRKRGRSTSTVNTYASELSHFIRFLARSKSSFQSVTDEELYAFASHLKGKSKSKPRSGNQVNRIIGRSIAFLAWLQQFVPGGNFVGGEGDGSNVTIERRSRGPWRRGGLFHPSFIASEEAVVVRPMADEILERLLDACTWALAKSFTISRNIQMVSLLSDTGIRREELIFIRTEDVSRAKVNQRLGIRTSKKKEHPIRQVPLHPETLAQLSLYMRVDRQVLMRRLHRKGKPDSGWLFCTQSGTQMKPATVTQMFALLKRAAGITEKASPHMLRHRWITLRLVGLLNEIGKSGPLSADLITTSLSRLAAETGHASLESLWTYVDLSFEQILAEVTSGRAEVTNRGRDAVLRLRRALTESVLDENVKHCLDEIAQALMATYSASDGDRVVLPFRGSVRLSSSNKRW